jgi:hypothetical protein
MQKPQNYKNESYGKMYFYPIPKKNFNTHSIERKATLCAEQKRPEISKAYCSIGKNEILSRFFQFFSLPLKEKPKPSSVEKNQTDLKSSLPQIMNTSIGKIP